MGMHDMAAGTARTLRNRHSRVALAHCPELPYLCNNGAMADTAAVCRVCGEHSRQHRINKQSAGSIHTPSARRMVHRDSLKVTSCAFFPKWLRTKTHDASGATR